MTLNELRAAATEHGYLLVHKDRIRTVGALVRWQKDKLERPGAGRVREMVRTEIARHLAHEILKADMVTVQELFHQWDVEFRADLQVLGPKSPSPDSQEFFIGKPRFGEVIA
jgi:hypothetical protein